MMRMMRMVAMRTPSIMVDVHVNAYGFDDDIASNDVDYHFNNGAPGDDGDNDHDEHDAAQVRCSAVAVPSCACQPPIDQWPADGAPAAQMTGEPRRESYTSPRGSLR